MRRSNVIAIHTVSCTLFVDQWGSVVLFEDDDEGTFALGEFGLDPAEYYFMPTMAVDPTVRKRFRRFLRSEQVGLGQGDLTAPTPN